MKAWLSKNREKVAALVTLFVSLPIFILIANSVPSLHCIDTVEGQACYLAFKDRFLDAEWRVLIAQCTLNMIGNASILLGPALIFYLIFKFDLKSNST